MLPAKPVRKRRPHSRPGMVFKARRHRAAGREAARNLSWGRRAVCLLLLLYLCYLMAMARTEAAVIAQTGELVSLDWLASKQVKIQTACSAAAALILAWAIQKVLASWKQISKYGKEIGDHRSVIRELRRQSRRSLRQVRLWQKRRRQMVNKVEKFQATYRQKEEKYRRKDIVVRRNGSVGLAKLQVVWAITDVIKNRKFKKFTDT